MDFGLTANAIGSMTNIRLITEQMLIKADLEQSTRHDVAEIILISTNLCIAFVCHQISFVNICQYVTYPIIFSQLEARLTFNHVMRPCSVCSIVHFRLSADM